MYQYMNLCPPDCPCLLPPPMLSFLETWLPLFVTVSVSHSPCLCSHTLFKMCTCIITWIYVHLTVCPCIPVCLCPTHLICVPTPCLECVQSSVHEFMSTWLPMYGSSPYAQFDGNSQSPHLFPSPCLECVHASVHEFMSTWLSSSGTAPVHTLMSSWVPLYGSVFVS